MEAKNDGRAIRVLQGVEPGEWWDVWNRVRGEPGRIWLGVVEGPEEQVLESIKRQWPWVREDRVIFWKRPGSED